MRFTASHAAVNPPDAPHGPNERPLGTAPALLPSLGRAGSREGVSLCPVAAGAASPPENLLSRPVGVTSTTHRGDDFLGAEASVGG